MAQILKTNHAIGPQKETDQISISELFHENTKLQPDPLNSKPPAEVTPAEMRTMASAFKEYTLAYNFPLPPTNIEEESSPVIFDDIVSSRRSVRNFANEELSLEDLSKILQQTYGITGSIPIPGGGEQCIRASASAGALYPAEIYLGIRKVKGLKPGLYHYNVPNHELELLKEGDPTSKLSEICCGQDHVEKASVIFLISGVVARTKFKYGERGYRYVLLDIGHLGQNLYLSCTALDLAVMTTCGFYDDLANEYLSINGIDETTFYVGFVGKKEK